MLSMLLAVVGICHWFATDMDKTLVFYDAAMPTSIALPASSGTGKVGHVAVETLQLLDSITQRGTRVICVSGQRASTMIQRAPYFPSIKFWVCEGGSRLFVRDEGGQLLEDYAFAERIYAASGISEPSQYRTDLETLRNFGSDLESSGHRVDTNGLQAMLRVKVDNAVAIEGILATLPARLRHTFNLGYLDITLAPIDKKSAIVQVIADHSATQTGGYVFMGDDDNDLTAAQHSLEAFIARPCSSGMRSWLATLGVPASFLEDDKNGEESNPTISVNTGLPGPKTVTIPSHRRENHEGCIALLRRFIETQD
jgi:hydroxymethylpyrimidine pyrophosphatase-like HAD family hydrolase